MQKLSFDINIDPTDWSQSALKPFQKHFYTEMPAISARSSDEVNTYRRENEIWFRGKGVPRPITSFAEIDFPPKIMEHIKSLRFEKPTPIQCQTWPIVLQGRDLFGIAETGSGKTMAFVLPAIVHILAQPKLEPGDGPIALIMAPTRELACQIEEECFKFSSLMGLRSLAVYGGTSREAQRYKLERGVEILIACPGRLLDFLS